MKPAFRRLASLANVIYALSLVQIVWLVWYFYTGRGGPSELACYLVPVALVLQMLFHYREQQLYPAQTTLAQIRRKNRHSLSRARRAAAPSLARKRNDAIAAAVSAPHPAKSIAKDATAQVGPQLTFDKVGSSRS